MTCRSRGLVSGSGRFRRRPVLGRHRVDDARPASIGSAVARSAAAAPGAGTRRDDRESPRSSLASRSWSEPSSASIVIPAHAARAGRSPVSPTTSPAPSTSVPARRANGIAPPLVPYPVRTREIVPTPSSEPPLWRTRPRNTVVTPASARAIVSAIWGRRATAIYNGDKATLEALETGSALCSRCRAEVLLRPGRQLWPVAIGDRRSHAICELSRAVPRRGLNHVQRNPGSKLW